MASLKREAPYKDGYYLELYNRGNANPILIHRDTQGEIDEALESYGRTKKVKYLGEVRQGILTKWESSS
jgi:hypothetical protein